MKALYLHNPTYLQLDDIYRSLPVFNSVYLKSSNYGHVIQDLEKIGFVAIEITSYEPTKSNYTIRAFKGKHGPCNFSNKKVKYTGAALAVLDDDNHILFSNKWKDVCDKTYEIFGLPAYQGMVERKIDLQQAELENESRIVEGESDDFESSQATLFDHLKKDKELIDQRRVLFYPGPFRLLILSDGSMVYRGKWCNIPVDHSQDLISKDKCIISGDDQKGHLSCFQEEYVNHGSTCLLNDFIPEVPKQADYETDFSKLYTVSKELKSRIRNLISKHKKYFLLIGNDFEDTMGCCPSHEATEANQLVRYGILSSVAELNPVDSCPVTIYAFKNELAVTSKGFTSKINEEFRSSALKQLDHPAQSILEKVLKWVLLIFVIISLGVAFNKCQSHINASLSESYYAQINSLSNARFMVVLFHNRKRCHQCLQMEKHTLDLLNNDFNDELIKERLEFKAVIMDQPENLRIVNKLGLFAPTVVLFEFNQKELIQTIVLLDASALYRDDMAFKNKIRTELHRFLGEDNE